jgi:hypothetical protein
VDPAHPVRARLRARNVERCQRRIDADDIEPSTGQEERERARTAADVEHAPGAELLRDARVHLEVAAVGLERVVDLSQSRVLDHVVGHRDTVRPLAGATGCLPSRSRMFPSCYSEGWTTISEFASGSRTQNIGGTGPPYRLTSSSTSAPAAFSVA